MQADPPSDDPESDPQPDDPEPDNGNPESGSDDETDPREVTGPVVELIHRNLGEVKWKLYTDHQMCFIFDSVTPARQWKRDTVYTSEDPWVEYGRPPWPDLTEADEGPPTKPNQKAYYPVAHV